MPRPLYPGKDPVSIVQEAGWAPGPVWTGAENLTPTGIRFPNLQARSQSLYRLSYSVPVRIGRVAFCCQSVDICLCSAADCRMCAVHWRALLVQWCVSVAVTCVEAGRDNTVFEPKLD
jgi:hypothetical protein